MGMNGGTSNLSRLLADSAILNRGTEDELHCYGYQEDKVKKFFFLFLVVVTFGLILLLLYWKPELECYLKKSKCALYKADTVLLEDHFQQKYVCPIKTFNLEEELSEFSDAYNRDESSPENQTDVDDVANLTVQQPDPIICYFDFQHVRYIWSKQLKTYTRLLDLSANTKCGEFHEKYKGLSVLQQAHRRVVYGENSIEVEVKSYWRLLIEEVLNPFYIFQIASIILWSLDSYYYYAACIFLISCISMGVSLYETKRQMITLHNMVSTAATSVMVVREDGTYDNVPVTDLVPGDVIVIPSHGCTMTCDAVLMAGTCIVNESMLTGESVPITKTPLHQCEDEEIYSAEQHKRHTLFSGTKVIQTRYYGQYKVLAVVIRTGFSTAKGELVRAILFPKPLGFKFYQDAMRFIMFLAVVAFFGMCYSIAQYIRLKASPERIILRVLDIITIIVPPALPAAMTVGTVYAQNRLKKKQIYCISPPRINFCGRLNLLCFDKTGTLTEDGLDLGKVIPVKDKSFRHGITDPSQMERGEFLVGMATCHSLTIIDGEISGDPMDVIMFNATKWTLEEPGRDTSKFDTIMPTVVRPATKDTFMPDEDLGDATQYEVGIVRQFTFSSSLKRMSVITRTLGKSNMEVYCKGAVETVCQLCKQDTVPEDIDHVLHQYAVQGFRVIGLACRSLDPKITWHQAQRLSRDKVECDMTFLGLIVMQNKLKRETKPVIKTLLAANLRCVMITGDMITTAICVARNCGMVGTRDRVVIVEAHKPENNEQARIEWELSDMNVDSSPDTSDFDNEFSTDFKGYKYYAAKQVTARVPIDEVQTHLAITGKSFAVIEKYFPHLLPRICVQGTIFARMLPDQKCQLIQKQQELGYIVGMCGDGANDCEALKAAHAGISLSEAEASVAAPFTSRVNHIECVVTLIREGRGALVTSFGCFKYMALYSFIQFISVMILYTYGVNLGDMQFLYIDLVITTTIAVLMGYTQSYERLSVRRPEGSLVKASNILSILLQVFCAALFQTAALIYLKSQAWYVEVEPEGGETMKSWESTVIFIASSFQYIVVAFVFSKGPPFRKPIYTNIPYLTSLLLLTAFSACLVMVPWKPFMEFFTLMRLDEKPVIFRGLLLTIVAAHFVVAVMVEYFVTDNQTMKSCMKRCVRCVRPKKSASAYKKIGLELLTADWPPVGQVTYAPTVCDSLDTTSIMLDNIPLADSINR
ncbi:polyamine-transporting ATPase 13A3-like isoform X2 [Mercenaria mercenaria]|uniref:polyamine-transporting ATPase 13A3-like isoform X2 n=1 Tax=Mercenaria mercenaria TaxID=6596 RepID=UPI00234FB5DD|nr:polyamine-transporting ATPase 13A3-like isoform X2 [Mercenaria mercenaria]